MIRPITSPELPACLALIQSAFAPVMARFHVTKDNAPYHVAFMALDDFVCDFDNMSMYGYFCGEELAGFVALEKLDGNEYRVNYFTVAPEHQRRGIGAALLNFCKAQINVGETLSLYFINANEPLKAWYIKQGLSYTGTRRVDYLPFEQGRMEWIKTG